jgi:hypothetical protein
VVTVVALGLFENVKSAKIRAVRSVTRRKDGRPRGKVGEARRPDKLHDAGMSAKSNRKFLSR